MLVVAEYDGLADIKTFPIFHIETFVAIRGFPIRLR